MSRYCWRNKFLRYHYYCFMPWPGLADSRAMPASKFQIDKALSILTAAVMFHRRDMLQVGTTTPSQYGQLRKALPQLRIE